MRSPIQAIVNCQLLLLLAFAVLNVTLVAIATNNIVDGKNMSATFSQAADGQKYWGVATSLVDSGTFSIPQEDNQPLAKAGPLTPLVFAAFIKISSLDFSAVLIVTFQCLLLFIISLFSRSMASYFGAPPNLVQALVLFNPNLIGLCHLAQSDILFAFLFTSFTWVVIHKLFDNINIDRKSFLLLGGILGLMMLTRAVGQIFVIIVIPLIFLCVFFQDLAPKANRRHLVTGLAISACIAGLIYSPWMIRNIVVLNQPTAMASEAHLRDNYAVLISNRDSISVDQVASEAWGSTSRLSPITMGGGCADSTPFLFCFVSAVFQEDPQTITRAVISSLSGTLLAGGASALANYLGIPTTNPQSYAGFITIDSYRWFISTLLEGKHKHYFWLVILTSGFSITLRLAGVVGCLSKLKSGHQLIAAVFLLLCIIVLLAMYLFYGVSRFRAPFEPILMIFGAIGLVTIKNKLKQFFSSYH